MKYLLFLIPLIFIGCGDNTSTQINTYAKAYKTNAVDEYSYDNVKRTKWYIQSDTALTKDERAYTTYKAAQDCKTKTNSSECTVYQLATPNGYLYGSYFYTVGTLDKSNTFKIEVTDRIFNQREMDIAFNYSKARTEFKDMEAKEFEDIFTHAISTELQIPLSEVRIPWITREEYKLQ